MAKGQKRSSREVKKPKSDVKKPKTPAYQAATSLKEGSLQASPPKKKA